MARIAVSIQTLANEVLAISPRQTIYFYDNDTTPNSDHDPNDFGVICACDIMQGNGLDLNSIAEQIRTSGHPELAYVIWNKRIASRNTGFKWVEYHGESDHTDHIHASVGIGPDAHKRPPYDSTRPWLGGNDMTPEEHNWLANLFIGTYYGGPSCGEPVDPENVVNGEHANSKKYRNGIFSQLKQIRVDQKKILDAIAAIPAGESGDLTQIEAAVEDVLNRTKLVVGD